MAKRPEYTLAENFTYRISIQDSIDLPKYSHITPMDARWVPNEVKNRIGKVSTEEIYAYTKFGIIIIPKKIVRVE